MHLKSYMSWMRVRAALESRQPQDKEKGMTLIEILIVIALLAGLMAILVTNISKNADDAKADQSRIQMSSIAQALQAYRIQNNRFPTTEKGLQALITDPGDAKRWRGPYIEEAKLRDPWDNPFEYESDGNNFTIKGSGIDGQFGTADDIFYPEPAAGGAGDAAPAEGGGGQ